MRKVFRSSELAWGWPDGLVIGWGLWFAVVAMEGGELPVLWHWVTGPAPALAAIVLFAVTPALVWIERAERAPSASALEEQRLLEQRRLFLAPRGQFLGAFLPASEQNQVRLGLLADWPRYDVLECLSGETHIRGFEPPAQPQARLVRVDEGVIEFRLDASGSRIVTASNFYDRFPTRAQCELALRVLVDYQEMRGEPSWFPEFDRAALLQQWLDGGQDGRSGR